MMPHRLQALNARLAALDDKTMDKIVMRDHLGPLAFEQFWHDPIPSWIKGIRRTRTKQIATAMLCINPAYSARFGVPLYNFLGKTDDAVWKNADNFEVLDKKVFETGEPNWSYEHNVTPERLHLGGMCVKWPVRDEAGKIIAIAGRAIAWRKHSSVWEAVCTALIKAHIHPRDVPKMQKVKAA